MKQNAQLHDELVEALKVVDEKINNQKDLTDDDMKLIFMKLFIEEENNVRL